METLELKKIRAILDLMIEKNVEFFEYKNLKVQLRKPIAIQEDALNNKPVALTEEELLFYSSGG